MKIIEIEKLAEWLGPDGAIAGLEGSNLTVHDLYELAAHFNVTIDSKMKRSEIISELINGKLSRIEKTTNELLEMNYENLRKYLEDRKASRTELMGLLSQFGIQSGSEARKNLIDFIAREISDLGMYQRIAKGKRVG